MKDGESHLSCYRPVKTDDDNDGDDNEDTEVDVKKFVTLWSYIRRRTVYVHVSLGEYKHRVSIHQASDPASRGQGDKTANQLQE